MTFPLEFDLLMIGVCTFIKKIQKKTKKNRFFVVGFIIGGLSEIFMRDELRESSLRSFVTWIMTDMYLI